ncbi:uncharacterized protein LOC105196996 [Solenopsis invicta]|uniref:uncharacterized protein LOC105196996 n=1 Tax=Solenopsis invicta TaxID=13686 RepID=UPI0005961F75|nr:uncharacterized protein LOC105196996 [Solenopsis invicta]
MLLYTLIVFSAAVLGLSSANKHTLSITSCKRDSDDYSACLKRAFQEAWPRFVTGIPEFDFPSLDPLYYKYGKAVYNSGLIHADVIVSNVTVSGLSKNHIFDIRTHFLNDTFSLEIDGAVPKMFLQGTVNIDGTLGDIFRVVGKGPFNLTIEDAKGTWELTGHVVNDTWIVEHFRTLPSVKKLQLYFDFFPNNKEFNDLIVTFANEYWPSLFRVMLPISSIVWDPWLTGIANKLFSKVSFSEVFL